MKTEVWISIKSWEGIYEVSNTGLVKRLAIITISGQQMRESIKKLEQVDGGYLRVMLIKRPRFERYMVNRLVANHFIPNPDNKPEVNHLDGNKQNNHASNLEWSTKKENIHHAFRTGLKNNSNSKEKPLDKNTVLEIFNSPLSLTILSREYKIKKLRVQSIKSGKRYGAITGKEYLGIKY